jgi:hypothetical protein
MARVDEAFKRHFFVQNVSIALSFSRLRETVAATLTKAVHEDSDLAESLLN